MKAAGMSSGPGAVFLVYNFKQFCSFVMINEIIVRCSFLITDSKVESHILLLFNFVL